MKNLSKKEEPDGKDYASVCWEIWHIRQALKEKNITTWTNKGCHTFLDAIKEKITEAMCTAGWNVIHNNLDSKSLKTEFPCQDTQ